MKTGDYLDLSLTDTLLCDNFENSRTLCLDCYKIDPCHYISARDITLDGELKMTKVMLQLITDPSMYCFLESGIRGGISVISERYARTNTVQDNNYSDLPSSHIII